MDEVKLDIIGDIHGQADKLHALLAAMGYAQKAGAWRHSQGRQALFVGDFVDRGPGQLEVLRTVRAMVQAGSAQAILGNHEFNAIAYFLPDPDCPGQHLRRRTDKNTRQHARFLEEVGADSPAHREWMEWFLTLPLWLETPSLRVVHACWHPDSMAALAPHLAPGNRLTRGLVERASRAGTAEFAALEALCKGLEVDLPGGMPYHDAEGTRRTRTRTRWWDETATTYRDAALIAPALADQLPDTVLPACVRQAYDQEKPLFFGHYWFTGTPGVLGPKLCCLDYSAARPGHPLVAYRFDGESLLDSRKLVSHDACPRPVPAFARP